MTSRENDERYRGNIHEASTKKNYVLVEAGAYIISFHSSVGLPYLE